MSTMRVILFLQLTCCVQFRAYFRMRRLHERMLKKAEQRWWNWYMRNCGISKTFLVCKRGKYKQIEESEQEGIHTLSLQISELLWMKLAGLNQTCYKACTHVLEFFVLGLADLPKSLQLQKDLGSLDKSINSYY